MPLNKKYIAEFQSERFYHVYNRTNNKEVLFQSDDNRRFFMSRYWDFLFPYVKTLAYSLLPNHFHFIIKTRSLEIIIKDIKSRPEFQKTKVYQDFLLDPEKRFHSLISKQFSKVFSSYAQAYNKAWDRRGNLLHTPFRRVEILSDLHLLRSIFYTHINCAKHGVFEGFREYPWNSYSEIESAVTNWVEVDEVLSLYGGLESFKTFHQFEVEDF